MAHDQRYCVRCGERRDPLPPAVAELLGLMVALHPGTAAPPAAPAAAAPAAAAAAAPGGDDETSWLDGLYLPGPRVVAIAIMGLLAFGVLIGSLVSPAGQSLASSPILVSLAPQPTPAVTTTTPAETPSDDTSSDDTTPPQQVTTVVAAPTPAPDSGGDEAPPPTGPVLPPVKHVFVIALAEHGYEAAFGANSQAPYLAKTLTGKGELLANYYAVAQGELANEIALVSGQGPNPDVAANCTTFSDMLPGTLGDQGQAAGNGCVFPHDAATLPDELISNGNTWKAYVEDIGNGPPDQPKTCRHPAVGSADPFQAPVPGDAYVTWRNPFVYFHSLIDGTSCTDNDVGLDQLTTDLKDAKNTPSLAYIVPDRCHDGSDQPCAPGQPAGLPTADAFLKTVVPEIQASPAYKDGGLIAITFDQAPQTGPDADPTACCDTPTYPNLNGGATGPTGPTGPAGASGPSGPSGPTGPTGPARAGRAARRVPRARPARVARSSVAP